jgi:hypothetical protein
VADVVVALDDQHHQQARNFTGRKFQLQFGHSRCQTMATIAREMAKSHCTMILHKPYSSDFAICDFWLFGPLKNELQ